MSMSTGEIIRSIYDCVEYLDERVRPFGQVHLDRMRWFCTSMVRNSVAIADASSFSKQLESLNRIIAVATSVIEYVGVSIAPLDSRVAEDIIARLKRLSEDIGQYKSDIERRIRLARGRRAANRQRRFRHAREEKDKQLARRDSGLPRGQS